MEVEEEQETRTKIQRLSSDNTEMMRDWNNPSSRIIRVSRASGGKDRHSKVLTSKGLRDRRIRLSVGTAIQFYDLQDRLGFDQPSKAVEWLINAASDSISQLPPLNTTNFHDQTQQQHQDQNQNKNQNQTRSSGGCSSGTSESSLLSLSRTEIRGKARDRARERTTAKEQENPSFTQLLTGGFNNRTWTGSDSFLPQETSLNHQNQNQFSFVPDYNFGITSSDSPVTAINGGGYNGSRGTLQSNSQSLFLNNQRSISSSSSSSSPMDSQSISFFMATPPPLEQHNHQLPASFDGRLYLYYGEGNRSSDDKGKHRR